MKNRTALFLAGLLALLGQQAQAQISASVAASAYGERGAVLHRPTYHSSRVWVPARFVTEYQQVWVAAHSVRTWKDPIYQTRIDSCGNRLRVLLCAGGWQTTLIPGHFERRPVCSWRPGHWAPRGTCE